MYVRSYFKATLRVRFHEISYCIKLVLQSMSTSKPSGDQQWQPSFYLINLPKTINCIVMPYPWAVETIARKYTNGRYTSPLLT